MAAELTQVGEDFNFVSLKEYCEDKRKVSRKKHALEVQNSEIYPPEGHVAFHIGEKNNEIMFEDNFEYVQNTVFFVGGASRHETSTWGFASQIYFYKFESSENDVWISRTGYHDKIVGAQIPPLSGSAGFALSNGGVQLVLWGGQSLHDLSPCNDLVILKEIQRGQKTKFQATIFLPSDEVAGEAFLQNAKLQKGAIPSKRFGHSFTKMDDQSGLMFGGLSCPYFNELQVNASNMFQKELVLGDVFMLKLCVADGAACFPFWQKLTKEPLGILSRAYHTTTKMFNNSFAVVGGLTYKSGKPATRFNLQELVMVSLTAESVITLSKTKLSESVKDVYISGHSAATPSDDSHLLFIYGGYIQDSPDIFKSVPPSSYLYVIDINNGTVLQKAAPSEHAVAGASLSFLERNVLLISGGTKKAFLLYTTKQLVADECDLGVNCQLDKVTVNPILWIFCDGKCNRWLHQLCAGISAAPIGKFICEDCKTNRTKKRKV